MSPSGTSEEPVLDGTPCIDGIATAPTATEETTLMRPRPRELVQIGLLTIVLVGLVVLLVVGNIPHA